MKKCYGLVIFFLLAGNATAKPVISASFDCNKASQPVEKSICSDAELAGLDRELATVYKNVLQHASGQDKSALRAAQRSWLTVRVADCRINSKTYNSKNTIDCLGKIYQSRINELKLKIAAEAEFYRASIRQEKFTLADRKKWQALVKWPDACEFDRLEYLSSYGYGVDFFQLNKNTYLLSVMCDMYAYQSVYELYLIHFTEQDIKTSLVKLPQLKSAKNKWRLIPARKITGHVQFNAADKTLLTMNQYSGAGQCGNSVIYQFNTEETDVNKFAHIKKAWGNGDCEKSMTPEDWPDIKLQ